MQMLHQSCRALKMLSFGILHKAYVINISDRKEQNGRHVGGAK